MSEELEQASLRKRRVQQWVLLQGKEECLNQLRQLKKAIAEDSDPCWAALVESNPSAAELEELVLKCRAEEDEVRLKSKAARRASWRQWVLAQASGGMRALFRWVRQGPAGLQSTGIIVRENGLYAGQKALLMASEEAWWPIWMNEEEPNWARVRPPRATEGWRPRPFTGRELSNLIWMISIAKAAGHDGWQTKRMRQWPLAVWHLVAILFEAVEAVGRWPDALRGGVVCLLPKGGRQATTSTPLEARPVVLLPMLYRMWAHKRGHEMAAWLTANGMEGLEDPSRSAEDYGMLLAADLERALVEDEALLAACVDQSKAYDNLRLDLLAYLLAGSWGAAGGLAAHCKHGHGPEEDQGPHGGRRLAHAHQRPAAGLPDSHKDPVPDSGTVEAVCSRRLPRGHAPMLGGRQHGGGQGRRPRSCSADRSDTRLRGHGARRRGQGQPNQVWCLVLPRPLAAAG